MLENEHLLNLFKERQALLEGHFILSSGRHSNRYFQSALLLQHPEIAEQLGREIAKRFPGPVDTVISPAIGGLIIGQEVARAKKCRAIFSEKDDQGKPVLRRNFSIEVDEKILVVEDVITTGLSTSEVLELVNRSKGKPVGVGAIINRAPALPNNLSRWNVPVEALLQLQIQNWPPDDCPLCKKGIPAIKPGSRKQ